MLSKMVKEIIMFDPDEKEDEEYHEYDDPDCVVK